MKIYSHSLQGHRESNEDQHVCLLNLDNNNTNYSNINLFGVFDGHGGKGVSKYLKDNILNYFIKSKYNKLYSSKKSLITKYFTNVFDHINTKLKEDHPRIAYNSGSTACIGIMYNDNNSTKLWILNVGDSRAVRCNKNNIAEQLSEDHKPNSPDEKKRIEELGGKIIFDGVDWRVKDYSLSRAFGDLNASPFITHLPQIYNYKINNDKFIIFACDGLWDILSNQEAVDFVNSLIISKNNINYARALSEYALTKGSLDNITVMVYFI